MRPHILASPLLACAVFAGSLVASPAAVAQKKTVCTITVNSADEKEAFRAALGPGQYDFVELVERGRPDWLESACRSGVKCDVLVISGHYDGGNEFFSDRTEAREYLPVDELERASCSNSCPGVFSQLKEVYLFGCNSLNSQANATPSAEVGRSLVRAGFSRAEADRMTRSLALRHGESSRDRMRLVFDHVPAIYGFSSVAPLGPVAGGLLRRHFQSGGAAEVATGRASSRLLSQFSAHALTVTSGVSESDPLWSHRQDVCQLAGDREGDRAEFDRRAMFVHGLLERPAAEVRMFLPRLERFAATIPAQMRDSPALVAIASDEAARERYMDLARDAESSAVSARMIALAGRLGWLDAEGERAEVLRMFDDRLARNAITPAEVDLACALNRDGDLDGDVARLTAARDAQATLANAALLACLGSNEARERVVHALTSPNEADVRFAQVVLRHRPLDDASELRAVTAEIARMSNGDAQMRALHALSSHRLNDPATLDELVKLYPVADSAGVQTAIAGILLRSEYTTIASPELVETLRARRLRGGDGENAIDILIRRVQANL